MEELLYWSMFERADVESSEFDALVQHAALGGKLGSPLADLKKNVLQGRYVAISFRSDSGRNFAGLCVFGAQEPSPGDEATLSVLVLSTYHTRPGTVSLDAVGIGNLEDRLLEKVVDFGRVHGYGRVHAYVPASSMLLQAFQRNRFVIEGVHRGTEATTYSLAHRIDPHYAGDPCDGEQLVKWLCGVLDLELQSLNENGAQANLRLPFLRRVMAGAGGERLSFGLRLVLCPQISIRELPDKGPAIVLTGVEDLSSLPTRQDLVAVRLSELRELTNNKLVDLSLWPPRGDPPSLAVEIRREVFDKFAEGRKHVFLDSGQYGTLVQRGLDKGKTSHIFFMEYGTVLDNPLLLGIGNITSIKSDRPESLWSEWGPNSSFDGDQFTRYRSIKRHMTGIVFENLKRTSIRNPGLRPITHSWRYIPADEAYRVDRKV